MSSPSTAEFASWPAIRMHFSAGRAAGHTKPLRNCPLLKRNIAGIGIADQEQTPRRIAINGIGGRDLRDDIKLPGYEFRRGDAAAS